MPTPELLILRFVLSLSDASPWSSVTRILQCRWPSAATTEGHIDIVRGCTATSPEQQAIAHILGTLDDKIELNRRMNETLEAMARALFKSWFVDFDPVVRAKAEGANPGSAPEPSPTFSEIPSRTRSLRENSERVGELAILEILPRNR